MDGKEFARWVTNMQTINEIYRHLAAQDANDDIKSMQEFFTT